MLHQFQFDNTLLHNPKPVKSELIQLHPNETMRILH